jgi:cell division protein FtsQ
LATPESAPSERRRAVRNFTRAAFATLLLGAMAAGGYALLRWEPWHLPVRVVTVQGDLRHISRQRLAQTVLDHLDGGILTQDLGTLQAAVEAMPWVRGASLRRVWPDRLELTVTERQPVARWGKDGLVTAAGVVFRPRGDKLPTGLPRLDGPDDQAPAVVHRFDRLKPMCAAEGLALESVTVDARGSWTLGFKGGLAVRLGTSHLEERVARFLYAYPFVAAAGRPETMDMRYSNGLAVRWATTGAPQEGLRVRPARTASWLPRSAATPRGSSRS